MANRCYLCGDEEETVDLPLVHCSKARALWDLLLAIFGMSWVFPSTAKGTLVSWHGSFVGKIRKKAWMTDPLCIFLTVWRIKNRLVFIMRISRLIG